MLSRRPVVRVACVRVACAARWLLTLLLATAMLATLPGLRPPARADDPILVNWPALLPGLVDQFNPNSDNACVSGRPECVAAAIREMNDRFGPMGHNCLHQADFALSYLRTTQTFQAASNTPGYFADPAFVNHEAAVFAKYYFGAYDNWAAGNRSLVPQAWLIAFDGDAGRRLTGSGDLLVGMSAHINRDLPFALAAIGLAAPNGSSRKPDHDKVNVFLNLVTAPLLAELAARLDSTTINIVTPYGIGYAALFQTIAVWREAAWRNAELLVNAPAGTRAAVAAAIEASAATQGTVLATANSYVPPVTTTGLRDTFCGQHNGDAPPQNYPFGPASAY